MVRLMTEHALTPADAAAAAGVSEPTSRKWPDRFLAGGEAALADEFADSVQPAQQWRIQGTGHRRACLFRPDRLGSVHWP